MVIAMKRSSLLLLIVGMVALLTVSSLPAAAQEQEPIPVSGTISYTWESPQMADTSRYTLMDGREAEIWSGDFEGTADAIWRLRMFKDLPTIDVRLVSDFTGTMLGTYEGTMTIIMFGDHPSSPDTQWYGEWAVVSGTGDLANVHGTGIWWGPGNGANDPDPDVPDLYYAGEVIFMEPPPSE
jgi:hypothetical protein